MSGGGKKPKAQIVGYEYHIGIHAALCHGPVDELMSISYADKLIYGQELDNEGNVKADQPSKREGENPITKSALLYIDDKDLLGGHKREGGVAGVLDVMFGEEDQKPNPYLFRAIGSAVPAFVGVVSLVFRNFYWGTNPYIKAFATRVRRYPKGFDEAHNRIGRDANPAHIVYECLTNSEWGMGYADEYIDLVNFTEVSQALYDESFGLSMMWVQQETLQRFLQDVMDHIGAVLRLDPESGKFQIKLIRDDYIRAALPVIAAEDIISMGSYQRPGWGETVNEISVKYRKRLNGETSVITVQNGANIAAQQAVLAQSKDYPGIFEEDLARRVAQRELQVVSAPLSKIQFTVNRSGYSQRIGDVFSLNWPKLGIGDVVFRVSRINYGTLESNAVAIEAVEDIFALPDTSYVGVQPIGWTDPRQPPAQAPDHYIAEYPYHELAQVLGDADAQALDPSEEYIGLSALRPSGDARTWQLARLDGTKWTDQGEGGYMSIARLQERVHPLDTAVPVISDIYAEKVEAGTIVVFAEEGSHRRDHEYAQIVAFDYISSATPLLTMIRGVHDTTPKAHGPGTRIFMLNDRVISDEDTHVDGTVLYYRQLPYTSQGRLDLDDAPDIYHKVTQRQHLPLPAGRVRINGNDALHSFDGLAEIQWAHRDRLQQTTEDLITQDDTSVGPEAGTTYDLEIRGETGLLLHTETGLTGTSFTYTSEEADSSLAFRLDPQENWRTLEAWKGSQTGDTLFDDESSALAAQVAALAGDHAELAKSYTGRTGIPEANVWRSDPYRHVNHVGNEYTVYDGTDIRGTVLVTGERPLTGQVWSDETRRYAMIDPAGQAFYRLNGRLLVTLKTNRDGLSGWQEQVLEFHRSDLTGGQVAVPGLVAPGELSEPATTTHLRINILSSDPSEQPTRAMVDELQFRSTLGVAQANVGTVFADDWWDRVSTDPTFWRPENAFNGVLSGPAETRGSTWLSGRDELPPHPLGIVLNTPMKPESVWIRANENDAARAKFAPYDADIEQSVDGGTTWQRIGEIRGETYTPGEEKEFSLLPAVAPPSVLQFVFTEAQVHPTLAQMFVTLGELELYTEAGGINVAPLMTVTPENTYSGYATTGLNDEDTGTTWGMNSLPIKVTVDLTEGTTLHSYAFVGSTTGGNDPYSPQGWEVWHGPDAGSLTLLETVTGNPPAAAGVAQTHLMPVEGERIKAARLRFISNSGDSGNAIQLRELQFRLSAGVPFDHSGDTAFSTAIYSAGYEPENVFDGDTDSRWASPRDTLPGPYLGVVYAQPRNTAAAEIMIGTAAVEAGWAPGTYIYEISYDSTDGHDGLWQPVQQFDNATPAFGDNVYAITEPTPGEGVVISPFSFASGTGTVGLDSLVATVASSSSGTVGTTVVSEAFEFHDGVTIEATLSATNADWYTGGNHSWHLAIGLVDAELVADVGFDTRQWAYGRPMGSEASGTGQTLFLSWNAENANVSATWYGRSVSAQLPDLADFAAQYNATNQAEGPLRLRLELVPAGADLVARVFFNDSLVPQERTLTGISFGANTRLAMYQTDYVRSHEVTWSDIKVSRL